LFAVQHQVILDGTLWLVSLLKQSMLFVSHLAEKLGYHLSFVLKKCLGQLTAVHDAASDSPEIFVRYFPAPQAVHVLVLEVKNCPLMHCSQPKVHRSAQTTSTILHLPGVISINSDYAALALCLFRRVLMFLIYACTVVISSMHNK
jgi:hypothetical protein